ncbi:MAG: hypothetical protein A2784_02420 [Candidatus Chisholmbacteria bacterium RIFCSPHIGHO2_01_FULL_48_12]|uniref:Uncharacterized protein n=1 Tax=Candidatus Chisholmbacteria bacterium RIFCSPHIGHO2_01_FULL_48_12 TaxID=1797589 RepID=A0A1G1VUA5_9BACT|nr:MAG: hypothetical protein A2784_02420 [Candidatus Chisholmbacteria bacterium RIFCSPHIGHO2_01_FULL_48_12]
MQETSPLPPTPTPKPKSLLILIGLVFLIILSVTGGFLLGKQLYSPASRSTLTSIAEPTSTPDPTANWKTYTNNQYKFVFKHPNDWRVISLEEESKPQEIVVTYNPDTKDAYLERNPDAYDQSQKSDAVINGVQITRIKNNKDVYRREYAIIPLTSGTLIITGTLDVAVNQKQTSSFNQILSTFKFLDQTNDTSN